MEFGLSLKQKEGLISIFDKHLKQGKVIVYGSRAKGNFTAQSDIDLVIQSSNATDSHLLATIHADIMESDFPYLCDIQYLEEIKSPRLLDHIKRMGKTFYEKESGMMAGWRETTLGNVCHVVNGGTPKTKIGEYWDGPHAWVTPAEMGGLDSPFIRATKRTLTDKGLKKSSASLLPEYSVVLSSRAPIGHLVINETPMATNQGCRGLIPHEQLHYKFLYYFLLGNVRLLNDLGAGATFKELSATKLKSVLMPIPSHPSPEQERIVAILDEAFAAIATATANTKKNLTNARELFESELSRIFQPPESVGNSGVGVAEGWAHKPLAEACLFRPPKLEAKMKLNIDDKVSFVSMKSLGIRQKTFDSTQAKPLGKVYGAYTYFADRDVLLAKITPCFQNGKLGIASGLKNGIGFGSSEFFVFRCQHQISPDFLFYFLSQQSFIGAGVAQMAGAVGHQRVPLEFIQSHPIPIPPISEQQRIAAFLDKLSAEKQSLVSIYEKKLNALTELKQSLLHKAFTGELTADLKAADLTFSESGV